jgi:hypothetical protein
VSSESRVIEVTTDLISTMTVGEIEVIEQRTQRPITSLFGDDSPRGVVLHAIAHVVMSREAKAQGLPAPEWEATGDVRVVLAVEDADKPANPTPASSRRTRRAV